MEIKKSQEELEFEENSIILDQMYSIYSYCRWEDSNYIDKCRTVEDLIKLYKFVSFTIGVEFVSDVYELIEEEEADGETKTAELVAEFNKELGYELL